jgi:hypothetical protein
MNDSTTRITDPLSILQRAVVRDSMFFDAADEDGEWQCMHGHVLNFRTPAPCTSSIAHGRTAAAVLVSARSKERSSEINLVYLYPPEA